VRLRCCCQRELPWKRLDVVEVLGYTWTLRVAGQVDGQVTDGTGRLV
jgi:hypothetical protein